MLHIATSVGVPVYLFEWTHQEQPELNVGQWHKNKNVGTFRTIVDLKAILEDHGVS